MTLFHEDPQATGENQARGHFGALSKTTTLPPVALALALGSAQALADSDTIVFNLEGSRSAYTRADQPRDQAVRNPSQSWYHDEDIDTIVFNMEGSRYRYIRENHSM